MSYHVNPGTWTCVLWNSNPGLWAILLALLPSLRCGLIMEPRPAWKLAFHLGLLSGLLSAIMPGWVVAVSVQSAMSVCLVVFEMKQASAISFSKVIHTLLCLNSTMFTVASLLLPLTWLVCTCNLKKKNPRCYSSRFLVALHSHVKEAGWLHRRLVRCLPSVKAPSSGVSKQYLLSLGTRFQSFPHFYKYLFVDIFLLTV